MERLPLLAEALASLAGQDWPDLEIIAVLQNGTEILKRKVREIVARQARTATIKCVVSSVAVPAGEDGRSRLLNSGIEQATGRYLAFLDDDDIVYPHAYQDLIHQLRAGGCAIAVGGCRVAKLRYEQEGWVVVNLETPFSWGRSRLDLFRENFIPINSFVLDRARLDPSDLYFDPKLSMLEDYEFLLRLGGKYEFDFTKQETLVCEYRIRLDGSNTIPYNPDAPPEVMAAYRQAHREIEERKRRISCTLPISEVAESQYALLKFRQDLDAQLHQLLERDRVINSLRLQLARLHEERLHEQSKVLIAAARKIYSFFGRYPRLEMWLSRLVHSRRGE